jgi:hypothetical protein
MHPREPNRSITHTTRACTGTSCATRPQTWNCSTQGIHGRSEQMELKCEHDGLGQRLTYHSEVIQKLSN